MTENQYTIILKNVNDACILARYEGQLFVFWVPMTDLDHQLAGHVKMKCKYLYDNGNSIWIGCISTFHPHDIFYARGVFLPMTEIGQALAAMDVYNS